MIVCVLGSTSLASEAFAQSCCGGLCADPRWSCSEDTCTDAQGAVTRLAPEAGFFELDPGFIGGSAARARMFYAFRPADEAPEQKPLLLFFQGGPFACMVPLWGGNTAPDTLDPARLGPDRVDHPRIEANPHSWTRFANLLYVDSPYAGFSYVSDGYGEPKTSPFLYPDEAAAFIDVLLRFLGHHPQLAQRRVVLVGESYGGPRAMYMLDQLLHYRASAQLGSSVPAEKLGRDIEAYLARTLGEAPEGGFSPEQVGTRFAQVLIEPAVGDWYVEAPSSRAEETSYDASIRYEVMANALLQPAIFDRLSGVAGTSIRWMYADARSAQSFHSPLDDIDERAFAARYGALERAHFYKFLTDTIPGDWPSTDRSLSAALRHVPSFMTNAGLDHIVDTNRIADGLHTLPGVSSALRQRLDARTEQVALTFDDGTARTLRLPSYPDSGHTVSMFSPDLLASDVQQWLAELPR